MTIQMDDQEKLEILKRNLRRDYKKALLWKPIRNLPELVEAGHLIDASNFSLYPAVLGNERSVNVVTQRNGQSFRQSSGNQPHQDQNRSEGSKIAKTKPDTFGKTRTDTLARETESRAPGTKRLGLDDPQEGSSKPRRTIDYLVAGFKPPPADVCLNCRQPNHQVEQCRSLKGLICYLCGFKGFDTQHCPYCQKNGRQTTESRRSSDKSA